MSNIKKSKKNKYKSNKRSDKYLAYFTTGGLILGTIIGTTITMITDNMFWMACAPIVGLFIGLIISSFISTKQKSK